MCVILPVSHIPCTHTVAIWQHCIDATRSGRNGVKPCWNVKQHEKSVITRRLCEDCSGQRFFARRGGVAERGNGSPTPSPAANDSADDSGYHSDVIHEEDEASDRDECPLSPKALAPRTKPNKQRKRTSSNHHSLTRKPSWKPNLKRELDFEYELVFSSHRRDSIDSLISNFDAADVAASMDTTRRPPTPSRKTRAETLLHPSSPTKARNTPSPQSPAVHHSSSSPKQRKNSTLLHPSSPTEDTKRRPSIHARRGSSLLHPSLPTEPVAVTQLHKTVLSVPPRRVPLLHTSHSEPQSATMAAQRRKSVLHSCLSDGEDEGERDRPVLRLGRRSENAGDRRYEGEVEEAMMRTARVARESRSGGRAGRGEWNYY
ncbi:hypothetical protein HBI18_174000 [Parastagonospora nodorum]|nr:hypothetical protein HBI75_008760 [Parastagonospora nodorum]KAH5225507.1 hypothetical protein HBH77_023770 [Parastagonospora nodorum]KAH5717736.1 hypothetical protein HBI18_174000 [Parastagonospora nodorum]